MRAGVRFSGRLVANGTQKWLRATSILDYIGPHGQYLRSCNILDAAKINGRNVVLAISHLCVCDTFDIARNVAKP